MSGTTMFTSADRARGRRAFEVLTSAQLSELRRYYAGGEFVDATEFSAVIAYLDNRQAVSGHEPRDVIAARLGDMLETERHQAEVKAPPQELRPGLTVRELIELLQALPPDLRVYDADRRPVMATCGGVEVHTGPIKVTAAPARAAGMLSYDVSMPSRVDPVVVLATEGAPAPVLLEHEVRDAAARFGVTR